MFPLFVKGRYYFVSVATIQICHYRKSVAASRKSSMAEKRGRGERNTEKENEKERVEEEEEEEDGTERRERQA